MNIHEMKTIIDSITYKPGWTILLRSDDGRPYIQAEVGIESDLTMDPTRRSTERTPWRSAKHYLSVHMCRQEVVGAVYGLIRAAEEHEMREWFRYKGASIFNPHLDPDMLAFLASRKHAFNTRESPMTMEDENEGDWVVGRLDESMEYEAVHRFATETECIDYIATLPARQYTWMHDPDKRFIP
jgi:hypothetical protein